MIDLDKVIISQVFSSDKNELDIFMNTEDVIFVSDSYIFNVRPWAVHFLNILYENNVNLNACSKLPQDILEMITDQFKTENG